MTMQVDRNFQFGDRVKHTGRPEWGIGTVVRTERASIGGKSAQRVSIRFPNAGTKHLMASYAALQHVQEQDQAAEPGFSNGAALGETSGSDVQRWGRLTESDWLSPVAQRKVQEAMIALPERTRDPFLGPAQRLAATLDLYRFDRSAPDWGRALIDWAVAQSGLDDPLGRFTRQELEQFFDRWAANRDAHLARLAQSPDLDRATIDSLLEKSPRKGSAARPVLRRAAGSSR